MNHSEVEYFLEQARASLVTKKLFVFIKYISIAEHVAANRPEELKKVFYEQVLGYYVMNQFEEVIENVDVALKIVQDEDVRLELLYKKGEALGRLGRFEEARQIFHTLVMKNLLAIQISSYISLAWLDILESEVDTKPSLTQAKDYCLRAMGLAKSHDQELYAKALKNLGVTYWHQGDFQNALQVFTDVNELTNGQKAEILNHLAATYISLGQAEVASRNIDLAEEIAEKSKNYCAAAECNLLRGRVAAEIMEDYLKAKDYYLIAYDYYVEARELNEAFKMLNRIAVLDQRIIDESYTILANRLGGLYLGKNT